MKKTKKSQASLYIVFFIVAIVIIMMAAVLAPAGIQMTTEMFSAGETILENANSSIQNIQDASVKAEIEGIVGAAQEATTTNVDVLGAAFQYAWIIIIVIAAVIIWLRTRVLVEFSGGGFV